MKRLSIVLRKEFPKKVTKYYIPSKGVESWKELLADPEKQWRTGFSARSLAYCWEGVQGFPKSVVDVFKSSQFDLFHNVEFVLGIPEHKVTLPGKGYDSQNDLFVLGKSGCELISIAVEGKVSEPFSNDTVEEWLENGSDNKKARMQGLAEIIGLSANDILPIRYQLIHRTASALLEADRFCAPNALMLVHSFSQTHAWLEDYAALVALYGQKGEPNSLVYAGEVGGKHLYLGWVVGEKEFLER